MISVRFHDETPEIANLYLGCLGDTSVHLNRVEQILRPETRNSHPPASTPPRHNAGNTIPSQPAQDPIPDDPSPSSLSFYSFSSTSPLSQNNTCTFTEREAILIRNFVENMALWVSTQPPVKSCITTDSFTYRPTSLTQYAILNQRSLREHSVSPFCATPSLHSPRGISTDRTPAISQKLCSTTISACRY